MRRMFTLCFMLYALYTRVWCGFPSSLVLSLSAFYFISLSIILSGDQRVSQEGLRWSATLAAGARRRPRHMRTGRMHTYTCARALCTMCMSRRTNRTETQRDHNVHLTRHTPSDFSESETDLRSCINPRHNTARMHEPSYLCHGHVHISTHLNVNTSVQAAPCTAGSGRVGRARPAI